jgi:small GTP-binding protein
MKELRFGVIGNVDSGKSTLIGVLCTNELDDGKGKARQSILKHPHEKKTGRTSSVSQNFIKTDNKSCVNFIDLAGHEKYLKTTIRGLSGYYIDYAIIIVGANMGVSRMTREHLSIVIALKIPFIVVITKTDMAPKKVYNETVSDIFKSINRRDPLNLKPQFIGKKYKEIDIYTNYPIISVSNKTGNNIDILKQFLYKLNPRHNTNILPQPVNDITDKNNDITDKDEIEFSIDCKYNVKGVGIVLSGKCISGDLHKNDKLYIGPSNGIWLEVLIKTFHNNFREPQDSLTENESGCIAIKINAKKDEIKNFKIRTGMILTTSTKDKTFSNFRASIVILNNHSTTIRENYEPIINCRRVAQCAKIVKITNDSHDSHVSHVSHDSLDISNQQCKVIRGGDKAVVDFSFLYKPEYIQPNDYFVFREGKTRGIGLVTGVGKM